MKPITILKLGGSAITDKSKDCSPNLNVIHNSADEIASCNHSNLVLLHGGGSYAHPIAMKYKLNHGYLDKKQLQALSEIELQLEELSRIVGVSLLLRNVPFVPIRPMSFVTLSGGKIANIFIDPIASALRLGTRPLIHGDMAFDNSIGFSIVSADRIASLLATKFPVDRVLFGSDVDGVYTADPNKQRNAELIREIHPREYDRTLRQLTQSYGSDASHGMYGKVREAIALAKNGSRVYFFNLKKRNILRNLLNNPDDIDFVGTRVLPSRKIT